MKIQINSDNRIDGHEDMLATIEARIRERLSRFEKRLTRIEVHLRDVDGVRNGPKSLEARIEARPAGDRPVIVTQSDSSTESAISGALRKMVDLLDSSFSKADAVR